MPPRAKKRKVAAHANGAVSNGGDNAMSVVPDRATWPGWVEMESEPALFNTMLKDLAVHGVKVQEVYGLDDEMLAILPQPVHAFIFLFRYRETDPADLPTHCPDKVWFAEQIPDFACASVALLNIVNNIPNLEMGKELRTFRESTKDMTPLDRGNAVDGFEHLRRVHNSFARENDLLTADMHLKEKMAKARKRQAVAKGKETRAANAAKAAALCETPNNGDKTEPASVRSSGRQRKPTHQSESPPPASPSLEAPTNGHKAPHQQGSIPDPETAFEGTVELKDDDSTTAPRRSGRAPQPRKDVELNNFKVPTTEDAEEEGFHFCAYLPVGSHVWKLDGMEKAPQDMGVFDPVAGWIALAQPVLQGRMAQYEAGAIEFNLMAVVHDPVIGAKAALAVNVKTLREVERKLERLVEDWREMIEADAVPAATQACTGTGNTSGVSEVEIDRAGIPASSQAKLDAADDLVKLLELRKETLSQQMKSRAVLRDEAENARGDAEKARHRRHDYGKFIRGWLGALAEHESLEGLVVD